MSRAPLTPGQSQFVQHLAANTGLNPGVLTSWVLAEESGGAAQQRQASNNHNWLNIGYFDSGPGAIAHAAAFSNPVSAANATAKFLKGQWGGASGGIQGILHTVGSNPMTQISAIANSGWASSHYNNGSTLRSLFSQYGGSKLGSVAQQRGGTTAVTTPTVTNAGLSGGQVDTNSAGIAALLSAANRPINTSGKLGSDPILKDLANNISSGQYTTPIQANTKNGTTTTVLPAKGIAQARSGAMPKGVANFGATQVAAWIKPILDYARSHGWTGTLTSGYRSLADQTRIYNSGVRPAAKPGTSNHEFTTFPGGAVDATQAAQLNAILLRSPYAKTLVWAGGKDPVHFSHPHNGGY